MNRFVFCPEGEGGEKGEKGEKTNNEKTNINI
jgi:hypothetical protein